MKNTRNSNDFSRRKFIKTSSALAASTIILPLGNSQLYGKNTSLIKEFTNPKVTLNNGVKMPLLGFGTNTLKDEIGINAIADAISLGYRLIDTATIYGNEQFVGKGIKQSGIDRKELFITSKLWVDDSGYESTKKAFQTSLDKLQTDYLDLYLIHRPRGDVKGTWKAMEELYGEDKIKAIGLSNFDPQQIKELMAYAKVNPTVDQIETHVFFQQEEMNEALKELNIQHEAWSPFAAARNEVFTNEKLATIGKKYGKTNAQVCLRWHYQRGIVTIARTKNKAHMAENLNIFDFELSKEDINTITTLDQNKTAFPEWG